LRGIGVVPEKAQTCGHHRGTEHAQLTDAGDVRNLQILGEFHVAGHVRDHRVGARGDHHRADGQAVKAVRQIDRIGSEPTGRAFNSVTAVVEMPTHTGNPLVNAGAIATTSLIAGADENEKWNKILAFYSKVAGEKLSLIDEVYKSEAATNAGNKALSMLLAKYERIYADPFQSVDIYTKQCSVGVNVIQLARMGATLANNGKNPASGEQLIKADNVPYILSSMMMAGLYDGSGGWAWKVGLPAKSGVGGGIVAVVPGKGAIADFSPRLDDAGNSVRAQRVIEYVARKLDLNLFSPHSVGLKG